MKRFLIITAIIFGFGLPGFAQIKSARLSASGLTCSMCSKAITKSLEKVPFIKEVQPDIEQSSYTILFKEGAAVQPDAIKKAVENAGFSVASLQITANIPTLSIGNDVHVTIGGLNLHFLNVPKESIQGEQTFTIVDKGFLTAKEYRRYGKYTQMACYQTGIMASCCTKASGASAGRIYHVTL